jgi:phosphatidylinositol-3-phosphatase
VAGPGVQGPGGGRAGAVLPSPFIRPGTVSEDIFGLSHLGDAAMPQAKSFGGCFTVSP